MCGESPAMYGDLQGPPQSTSSSMNGLPEIFSACMSYSVMVQVGLAIFALIGLSMSL